ncbi:MAG: ATP-binding cassette domain-containing protein [Acidobacteria bacterium]|nr:MAG: ATP-binding cassette domain-containing protein [Acidobacteriota bacterium]
MSPQGAAVRVRGLVTRLGGRTIHDGLDLEIPPGAVVGVVGASGSGKSVLLRTLLGLIPPAAGRIEVLGVDVQRAGPAARAALERRRGVLFQDGALFSTLTVLENVLVPLRRFTRLERRLLERLALSKIRLAGLPADVAGRRPDALSGGMRKRAGLARAIALDPEILFLDEPTAGLDPIGAAAFDELLARLARTLGLTVVMVTHDLDTLLGVCSRIAVLCDGRIVAEGPVDRVVAADHPWVKEYFHGARGRIAVAARRHGRREDT